MKFSSEDIHTLAFDIEGAAVPLDNVCFACEDCQWFQEREIMVAVYTPLFFCANADEANKLLARTR